MTKDLMIKRTVDAINTLPADKAAEISDFAEFVINRYETQKLTEGIQQLTSNSKAFDFLKHEEDIYSVADLKEVYNGES